ncbi:MBL fold metallo-hydrolase [Brachymonas denitrificans]|jgi:glyoxylase-like metal-dependent hydrolase (beta-lactamase superfamily II)|uniref:Glyoxylase, beta-lactamase superfamily II n=1 Tax=Brachymonas denitrificans DSM 15123 TaxID=1121117 RepID=A0A1H8ESL1_9BURK|nr:MBL fold metallo-hydrolase [Brachymonas denitrificans]SEN21867.1 Glyoxylase, beta-lactamase superfamily II [Brachymonas denitrificans DSM 15123]
MTLRITPFFDSFSSTLSYVLDLGDGAPCAIIDPVLDYDPKAGRTSTDSARKLISHVQRHRLQLHWIIETHAHADHLSAAPFIQQQLGGKTVIGKHITTVQRTFAGIYHLPGLPTDGSQFDVLLGEGEQIELGGVRIEAMHVPGHTPADTAWHVHAPAGEADLVFVGDTLFAPDGGTARCDFPGGSASQLYHSVHRLLALPDDTRLFLCHNYADGVADNPAAYCEHTVAEQRRSNKHVRDGISEEEFVTMRTARDATLDMPQLILPAVQVNIRAGALPEPEDNGTRYLKIPLDVL